MAEIHNPNKPTQSFRRRAVYTALAEFLESEERMLVMCIWQRKYSEQPAYALNKFISDICEFLQGQCSRAAINRKIVWALGLQPEQLDEDPESKMLEYCKHYRYQTRGRDELLPQEIVFQTLYSKFIRELNNLDYGVEDKIRKIQFDHLGKLERDAARTAIEAWLLQGENFVSRMFSLQQMRKIIHIAYVCGCEYCGPSQTDRAMTLAIKHAALLPESRIFPPEQFT